VGASDDRPFPLVQFNPLGEPQRDQALWRLSAEPQ
jgi:hypothetical protein